MSNETLTAALALRLAQTTCYQCDMAFGDENYSACVNYDHLHSFRLLSAIGKSFTEPDSEPLGGVVIRAEIEALREMNEHLETRNEVLENREGALHHRMVEKQTALRQAGGLVVEAASCPTCSYCGSDTRGHDGGGHEPHCKALSYLQARGRPL